MNEIHKVLSLNFMGCLWGYMGMNLIRKGILPLFTELEFSWALACCLIAVAIGIFKSLFILKKTASRLVKRVEFVKSFGSMYKIFDLKFCLLVLCMMSLGIGLSFISGASVARGVIRMTIGYALLQSSFYFFKPAFFYGMRT